MNEIDLGGPAFSPVELEELGQEDPDKLRTQYGDARVQKMKGTLLPHSAPGGAGGSLGFDAAAPMPIVVDPDIPGQSYILEPGALTSTKENKQGVPASGFDRAVVRQISNKAMRDAVAREKGEPMPTEKKTTRKRAPKTAAAVPVPAAAPAAPEEPVEAETDLRREPPQCKIVFDFGEPVGRLETRYHAIFKEQNRLILVWNTDCEVATKYTPSAMTKPMTVVVGTTRPEEFKVLSLGLEFTDTDTQRQYLMLLIDQRG